MHGCTVAAIVLALAPVVHAATVTVYNDHRKPMADGHRVHLGAVAGPRWIKLGTKVFIGGRLYTVEDRTDRKYNGRWDLWRPWSHAKCLRYGRRNMTVKICR